MPLFADYQPDVHGAPEPPGLVTRPARPDDREALVALRVERGDATPAEATTWFDRLLERVAGGTSHLLVAVLEGRVLAYGAVDRLDRFGLPTGWYLGGVMVSPGVRRRGIGRRLTRERLLWVADRSSEVWYFVNATNRASMDLHAPLGFALVDDDLRVPGLTFVGGRGHLFRAHLAPSSSARRVDPR